VSYNVYRLNADDTGSHEEDIDGDTDELGLRLRL
jgi:hypothetical protein